VVANYDQGVGLDVQVSLWDGSDWIQLGGPVNQTPAVEGDRPSLTVAGGVPFVAWAQAPPAAPFGGQDETRAASWDGSAWSAAGSPLNLRSEAVMGAPAASSGLLHSPGRRVGCPEVGCQALR